MIAPNQKSPIYPSPRQAIAMSSQAIPQATMSSPGSERESMELLSRHDPCLAELLADQQEFLPQPATGVATPASIESVSPRESQRPVVRAARDQPQKTRLTTRPEQLLAIQSSATTGRYARNRDAHARKRVALHSQYAFTYYWHETIIESASRLAVRRQKVTKQTQPPKWQSP